MNGIEITKGGKVSKRFIPGYMDGISYYIRYYTENGEYEPNKHRTCLVAGTKAIDKYIRKSYVGFSDRIALHRAAGSKVVVLYRKDIAEHKKDAYDVTTGPHPMVLLYSRGASYLTEVPESLLADI